MSIIVAILVFGMIILIHEFGHFIVAKKCGIGVLEFSIGMGPRILSFEKGETRYSIKYTKNTNPASRRPGHKNCQPAFYSK